MVIINLVVVTNKFVVVVAKIVYGEEPDKLSHIERSVYIDFVLKELV